MDLPDLDAAIAFKGAYSALEVALKADQPHFCHFYRPQPHKLHPVSFSMAFFTRAGGMLIAAILSASFCAFEAICFSCASMSCLAFSKTSVSAALASSFAFAAISLALSAACAAF